MGGQESKVTARHDQELVAAEIATKIANEDLTATAVAETAEQLIDQASNKDDAITRNLSTSQREMAETIRAKLRDDPAFKNVMDGKVEPLKLYARYWSSSEYLPFPYHTAKLLPFAFPE